MTHIETKPYIIDEKYISPVPVKKLGERVESLLNGIYPEGLYKSKKIVTGWEHSFRHPLTVLTYVEYFGPAIAEYARITNQEFDLEALEIAAFFHDVMRTDDEMSVGHGAETVKLILDLYERGKIKTDYRIIKIACDICTNHDLPLDLAKDTFQLRCFRWCDELALVRYEDKIYDISLPEFKEVTPEFLSSRIPLKMSPDNVIRSFIVGARFMQRRIDYGMKMNNISETSPEILDVVLEAGVAAGFLKE